MTPRPRKSSRKSEIDSDAWGECWQRCSSRWDSLGRRIKKATGWKVWNPGTYGEPWHAEFRRTYKISARPILMFGLNPGPYGMAQTGIPFTDIKRLKSSLPKLTQALESIASVEVPGLAPKTLRPYLTRTFESSSVRVYRFLETAFGDAEVGMQNTVVANPCPLLFIDPETGKNVTPADLGRATRSRGLDDAKALLESINLARMANCRDSVETLKPSVAVLFGRDVQAAIGETLRESLGHDQVIDWEHPARAVPDRWARGLEKELRERSAIKP